MNKLRFLIFILLSGTLTIFSSCDDNGGDKIPQFKGALIVHEGNFGAGNGSISTYDEETMAITNNAVKAANAGSEIGSLVQSIYINDGIGYVICNSSDKVEFISASDLTYLANPETDISQPRYMTVVGNKGYITCWGPYDGWTLPDSYIAVLDLSTKEVIDSLECGSGPEGIVAVDNKLFIANSFETSVSVLNLSDNSSTKINLSSSPIQFVMDSHGLLWTSTYAGLQAINTSTLELGDAIAIENMNGKIAIDGAGEQLYFITAQPWPATGTEVRVFDTTSKTLDPDTFISGDSFYGINYNITTNKIYVADSKAFSGPGQVYIYDTEGTLLDDPDVAIGPSNFTFRR